MEDSPPATPESVLIRVFISSWLATVPKKHGEAFLLRVAEQLASEESLASLSLLRPPPEQAEVNRARKQAVAMFRRFLPVFLASLDEPLDI